MSSITKFSLLTAMSLVAFCKQECNAAAARPAETRPTNAYLDLGRKLPEFNLEKATPLDAAIDVLRNASHANIVVDWPSLQDAGVQRDAPVRIRVWDVTVDQALTALIAVVDHEGLIGHQPQNGVIVVAARYKLHRLGQVVRVYDVRPIIDDICEYRRLHAPTSQLARPGAAGDTSTAVSVDEATHALVRTIQATVEPQGWRDQTWADGFAQSLAGRLVITQTPENHRKIAELLRTLREGGSKDGTLLFGR